MKERNHSNVTYVVQVFQKKDLWSHVHKESVHEGMKPFKCNNYDASFSGKLDLNSNIRTVHEEKKPVKYNVCE